MERLTAIKDDVVCLGALRYQNDYFDAAIMINILYAVSDPLECLGQTPDLEAGGNAGAVYSAPGYRCEKGFEKTA